MAEAQKKQTSQIGNQRDQRNSSRPSKSISQHCCSERSLGRRASAMADRHRHDVVEAMDEEGPGITAPLTAEKAATEEASDAEAPGCKSQIERHRTNRVGCCVLQSLVR